MRDKFCLHFCVFLVELVLIMNKRYYLATIRFGTFLFSICRAILFPFQTFHHYHIIHECGLLEPRLIPRPRPPAHFPVQPFQNDVTEATALVIRLVAAAG